MTAVTTHYPLLVCGATFAGLGAAFAAEQPVLVVERSAGVGQEFIETFNPGSADSKLAEIQLSPFEQSLHEELVQRSLMKQGGGPIHLPGAHAVLCKRIQDVGLQVLFLTEIVEVRPLGEGFEVMLYNVSGFQTIRVDRIIDTTSRRFSQPDHLYSPIGAKRISAHLSTDQPEQAAMPIVQPPGDRAQIVQGRFPSERVLTFTVDAEADWPAARHSLQEYWRTRPDSLASWTLAATSSAFGLDVPQGPQELAANWSWLPSEGSLHPLQAFNQGYQAQQSKEVIEDGYIKTL
ncbi:hypothetical protein [Paenibacillus agricola]|uniref:Uncharacterized protein n=1 Tax=Paenibacillus agricola TaxID=2716264 RepID=A0ABX0J018_9BACL|nr:hypothetical protein [Paenibacillus agricola]NHN29602.1 hypothetical protein [Paenibacillus agricola]